MLAFIMTAVAFALGACSFGTTTAEFHFDKSGDLQRAKVEDGKEFAHVKWKVNLKDEKLLYKAKDVRAFEGQKVVTDITDKISESLEKIIPEVVDRIVGLTKQRLASSTPSENPP